MKNILYNQKGFSLLVIVVVLGLTGLIIGLGGSMLGLGELELGYVLDQGHEARAVADACAEEVLYQLRLDTGYTANAMNFGEGSCVFSITNSGIEYTITVTSTLSVYSQVLYIESSIDPGVVSNTKWQSP